MANTTPMLVSIPSVREQLGDLSKTTVYKIIEDGELDLVHIGRRSFVTGDSLTAYVNRIKGISHSRSDNQQR